MSEPLWQIQLFGTFALRQGEQAPTPFPMQKHTELLAYLALYPDRAHPREELIELLWPEVEPEAGRNRLRQTLLALRRALKDVDPRAEETLSVSHAAIALNREAVTSDVAAFQAAQEGASSASSPAEKREWLLQAIRLYRGELLRGWYRDWALAARERLALSYLSALRQCAQECGEAGDLEQAIALGRRAVEADPLDEAARCELMHWYAASGQLASAEKQYRKLERALKAELDIEPSETTRQFMESLRQRPPTAVRTRPPVRINTPPIASIPPSVSATNGASAPAAPSVRPARRRWLVPLASVLLLALVLPPFVLTRLHARLAVSKQAGGAVPALDTSNHELWAQPIQYQSGDRGSQPTAITTDASGNIYVTGFVDTKQHDVDYVTLKYAPDGRLLWQRRYNSPFNDCDRAREIAVDRAGNVYVTGDCYNGDPKKGGTDYDIVTVKYDPDGKQIWERRYDGPSHLEDFKPHLVLDGEGNVLVGCRSQTSPNSTECVLLKYRPDGTFLWKRTYHPEPPGEPVCGVDAMAVDSANNVYLACHARLLTPEKNLDWAILKYDAQGHQKGPQSYAGPGNGDDTPTHIFVDGADNVYVAGVVYMGEPTVGGGGSTIAVVKYAPGGPRLWERTYERATDSGFDAQPLGMTVDAAGNVTVVGMKGTSRTGKDWVILPYDATGERRQPRYFNGLLSQEDRADAVVADRTGNVYVAGTAVNGLPTPGNARADYTTIKYDPQGNPLWVQTYGGPDNKGATTSAAMAMDPAGNILVTGQCQGTVSRDILTVKYRP